MRPVNSFPCFPGPRCLSHGRPLFGCLRHACFCSTQNEAVSPLAPRPPPLRPRAYDSKTINGPPSQSACAPCLSLVAADRAVCRSGAGSVLSCSGSHLAVWTRRLSTCAVLCRYSVRSRACFDMIRPELLHVGWAARWAGSGVHAYILRTCSYILGTADGLEHLPTLYICASQGGRPQFISMISRFFCLFCAMFASKWNLKFPSPPSARLRAYIAKYLSLVSWPAMTGQRSRCALM